MAFHRRAGARFQGTIWPGFVDAITALLMVMIFVLTIFMVVQYVLNEEISNQDDELNALNAQLNTLADTLGPGLPLVAQNQPPTVTGFPAPGPAWAPRCW